MRAFYYHPECGERLLEYLVSAVYNTFNLFSPVSLGAAASVPIFLVSLTLLVASVVYFSRVHLRSQDIPRCLPLLFLALISGELLIASVKGAYPFGGDLRHQFILFPFLLITPFVSLDSVVSRLRILAIPLIGLVVIGICLNGALHLRLGHQSNDNGFGSMFAKEVAAYRRAFPEPEAVYLDQFSLIVFFAHYDGWQWKSLDLDRFEVTSGGRRIVVLRDLNRWNVNLLDERLYQDILSRLQSSGLGSTTVFSLRYPFPSGPWGPVEQDAFRRQVPVVAARHHLNTKHLVLDGFYVFGEFTMCRRNCSVDRYLKLH